MTNIKSPSDLNDKTQVTFNGVTHIENLHIGDVYYQLKQNENDPSEKIYYKVIDVNHLGIEESLTRIISLTGIRLSDGENKFPFTPPRDYIQSRDFNKLILYGVAGSGKTRCLYELVEDKIKTFNRIIVICSSPDVEPTGKAAVDELVKTITETDLIIWDNFPDGYTKGQNSQLGYDKLVEISSSNVKNFLMSMKSEYLEEYWDKINNLPELTTYNVVYGIEQVKNIVEDYGKNLLQFRPIYSHLIEGNVDKISEILHAKDPIPSAIYLYYREVIDQINKNTDQLDVVRIASTFDPPSIYYKHQFEILIKKKQNKKVNFLGSVSLTSD